MIDEDDLCAVVAGRLYAGYPAFRHGREIAVTEKKEQLSKGGKDFFTSLLAVYSVCKRLKRLFRKEKGSTETSQQNVTGFQSIVTDFFDFVIQHEPSLNRYFVKQAAALEEERRRNKNLFFKPIGLELLARLYAHFRAADNLDLLSEGLKTIRFENPGGVLDGIVWNSGKIEATAKARNAAFRLCLHLLEQTEPEEEKALLALLRELTKNPDYKLPSRRAKETHA